jgi:phosphoglycolate phosphatase
VAVVGGGVLGTMHAVAARRRGFEVVQLEREAEARGASVRNFGLVWVSGRKAGPELALALRARELWSELGAVVPGLGFRAAGSLTLATEDAELALLKEAAALPDTDRRGFELLDRAAVRTRNPAVFRRILGDEAAAHKANEAFEDHYAAAVRAGNVSPLPGAEETFAALRQAGVRVCLATGFSPATRDAIIGKLGWGGRVDLALSPADAGRGRPWPDLPLTALLRLGGAVSELAVAGDTASDIESGRRAGAAIVAGVLTGASTRADLEQVGAPLILDKIADILPHVAP